MRRLRRTLSGFAIAAALAVLSGCFAAPSERTPATNERDRELPGVEASFAEHGIAVIEDVTEDWPEDAVMASPASAIDVMQAEVESGGGLPGVDLDEMIIMPEGAVPFSYLIAAWLSDPSTPRAEIAREWMPGTPDWTRAQSIWYPRAALLLFVADAMEASLVDFGDPRAAASGPESRELQFALASMTATPSQGVVSAPCSAVAGFFRQTIDQVFSAVQLPPDFLAKGGVLGAVSGFLASLYNTAVALAKQAALAVIESLTAPILHAIGTAVAIVGLVSHLSTYVLGISMTLLTEREIRLDGHEGDWFAVINSNRPLEPQLTDCLATLGQKPLRKIIESGAGVTWHEAIAKRADGTTFGRPTLVYLSLTSTVDASERIVLPWTSATDITSSQPEQVGVVGIRAEVPKADVAQLLSTARRFIDQAIAQLASNAGPLEKQVDAAIRSVLSGTLDRIEAEILGVGGSALMIVGRGTSTFRYHDPDPPSGPAGDLTPDCFVGEWQFQRIASSAWINISRTNFRRFTLEVGADGRFVLSVRGSLGAWDPDYDGSAKFTVTPNGAATWTVSAPDLLTKYTAATFGEVVFGQGLSPVVFSCSADGATLQVTGKPSNSAGQNYGSTVWQFRRM